MKHLQIQVPVEQILVTASLINVKQFGNTSFQGDRSIHPVSGWAFTCLHVQVSIAVAKKFGLETPNGIQHSSKFLNLFFQNNRSIDRSFVMRILTTKSQYPWHTQPSCSQLPIPIGVSSCSCHFKEGSCLAPAPATKAWFEKFHEQCHPSKQDIGSYG